MLDGPSIFNKIVNNYIFEDGRKLSDGTYTADFPWKGSVFEPFAYRLMKFYQENEKIKLGEYNFIERDFDKTIYVEYYPDKKIITVSLLVFATTETGEKYVIDVSIDFTKMGRFTNARIASVSLRK